MGLHANRIDRTGHQYGCVTVLGPNPDYPSGWIIHWTCCDRTQQVKPDRIRDLAKYPPKRCLHCSREERRNDPEYQESMRVRELARLAAKRAAEEAPPEGLHVTGTGPGCGWWPVLKGPFGRINQSGHETVDPGWRAQRGNAQ